MPCRAVTRGKWGAVARFVDRESAGRELGHRLRGLYLAEPVVRAVCAGGVDVGRAVARVIRAELDVADAGRLPPVADGAPPVRKQQPAAPAPRGPAVVPARVDGRTMVLVTDGLVAEQAALSAVAQARKDGARRVVLAVPVGTAIVLDRLGRFVDDLVALEVAGVSIELADWYEELPEVTDDEAATVASPVSARRHLRHPAPPQPRPVGRGQAGTAVASLATAVNRSSRVPTLRASVRWPPR